MKRIGVALILFGLFSIPSYSGAEILAPTGVAATEGTYKDLVKVHWDFVSGATNYEVWRDDYESCEGAIPCEPEFIFLYSTGGQTVISDWEIGFHYGVVFEYRIKACGNDEITNEYICSDFSLPAYGYVSEDAPKYFDANPPGAGGLAKGAGGGGGIFGDVIKSSVIGYHFDGFTTQGVQVYMPVTQGFKSLKGAQEYVRSFAPGLAEFVRKCFDFLERKADSNKDGFLYKAGTYLFPILGRIAAKSLALIDEQKFIDAAYSDTTISIEEYKRLETEGRAIAPKVVKEIENEKPKKNLSEMVSVY